MKEIGKEIIEIGGVEYTLFLNRKGVVAWEKYASEEGTKVREFSKKVKTTNTSTEITEETNPFEGLDEFDDLDENKAALTLFFQKLYWIMLYENHKFSFEKAKDLYNQACEEYGEEQLIALAEQMIEDVNINKNENSNLKNLKALRPTK